MRVEQIRDEETGACAYLLACEYTKQAAVVHAFAGLEERLVELADAHGWVIRYRIDTRLVDETVHYRRQFGGLLAGLGVRVSPMAEDNHPALHLVPRIGPVSRTARELDRVVGVETPIGQVDLRQSSDRIRPWKAGEVPEGSYGEMVLPLGDEKIRLIAHPTAEDELCVQVQGHLISGQRALAPGQPLMPVLLTALLDLPLHTLVWPRLVSAGPVQSTFGNEQALAVGRLKAALRRPSDCTPHHMTELQASAA